MRRPHKVFDGWWIVSAGTALQIIIGGLMFQSFSSYAAILREEFGWIETALSAAFSVSRVESGLPGPAQGWMIDRFGPSAMIGAGMVTMSGGFLVFSQVRSLWQLYVAFLVIAVGSSLAGHAIELVLLASVTSFWMIVLFAMLDGLAWGTRGPLMQAIRADYFGRTSFGTIMGFSAMIVMLGMTFGAVFAGLMADRTGNYEAGFTVLAGLAAMGPAFFILATPPKPPRRVLEREGGFEPRSGRLPASCGASQ